MPRLIAVFMLVLIATGGFAGCKKKRLQLSTAGYIIGHANDIEPIDEKIKKDTPSEHINAVVLVVVKASENGIKYCSGTLIEPIKAGENLRVLTNHHCFAADSDNQEIPRSLIPDHCAKTQVYFGFYKDEIKDRTVGTCAPDTFRNDYEGDLAIFTLAKNPDKKYQPAKFWDKKDIPAGRKARIIHFPTIDEHEASAADNTVTEKTVGGTLPVAQITVKDCETKGQFPQADWGLDKALGMGIRHTCDQKKGSSGSSLWDVETNTVLGINWGGISLTYKTGDHAETYNVATRASYVLDFIADREIKEKGEIVLGTELPDSQHKTERAANRTKKALKTGCGVVSSNGTNQLFPPLLLMLFLLPLGLVFIRRS